MNCNKRLKIAIADDHEFFRVGFRKIIQDTFHTEVDFVGEASNGSELIDCVSKCRPHVVITDIRMPTMSGIQATRIINKEYPGTGIIAFSMFDDLSTIVEMIQAGANGYLVKSAGKEEVLEAIMTTSRKEFYYCSSISDKVFGASINSKEKSKSFNKIVFSIQEQKVIQLICRQLSTKEIAVKMQLATRTVEHYRQNIQEKIGARNVVGIVLHAVVNDMVRPCELL